jgi:hypothetical protein
VCLPKPHAEIEEQIIREELAAEMADNRTLEEALKLARSKAVKPPDSYFYFCLMVNTTAALLFAMYRKFSPVYKNMLYIANILLMPCCKLNSKLFRKAFATRQRGLYLRARGISSLSQKLILQDFQRDQVTSTVSTRGDLTQDHAPRRDLPIYISSILGGQER